MNPLNIGAVMLFGLLIFGWLFQPAGDQQGVLTREPAQASIRSGGCGTLLLTGFLGLLLLLLLFGRH